MANINDLGNRGWELVGVAPDIRTINPGTAGDGKGMPWGDTATSGYRLYFKRPKPPLPEDLDRALSEAKAYGQNP